MHDSGASLRRQTTKDPLEMIRGNMISALAFISVAGLAVGSTSQLQLGTPAQPGPALFPGLAAALLSGLSLLLLWRGRATDVGEALPWRPPLAVFLAALIFAACIEGFRLPGTTLMLPALGMPVAGTLAMLASGLAGNNTRWHQLLVLAAILPLFFATVLRFALNQPVSIAPWWLGY
jgi:Tripartite tricarboxylate transporter TctB family